MNCTLIENLGGNGTVLWTNGAGKTSVCNSIVQNFSQAKAASQMIQGPTEMRFNCLQPGPPSGSDPAIGNAYGDPLFVRWPDAGPDGWGDNPATPAVDEGANDDLGDLDIRWGSVCIDAADMSLLPPDTGDLDGDGDTQEALPLDGLGRPRLFGRAPDIGACEYPSR